MKYTYSQQNIKSFGGLNFVNCFMTQEGIYDHISQILGNRGVTAKYDYVDLFRSYFNLIICGGSCAEDIGEHLRDELAQAVESDVPSPDTLLRINKELSVPTVEVTSESGIKHQFNTNKRMNGLLLSLLVKTGQLRPDNGGYTLDYDNQFIPADKHDSKRSYKKKDGYFPGIASIDNHPVYIEGRNGNSQVKYKQAETLENVFESLDSQGIRPKRARMDCGSFSREIIEMVESHTDHFYIRAQRSGSLYSEVLEAEDWEEAEIGAQQYELTSIEYMPFGGDKPYRYVISRQKKDDNNDNLFTGANYVYRAIITNDAQMSDLDVVRFYNARGNSERLFDEMNNDFLWKKMPFSFLNENTAFLIMTAICRNLFHHLTERAAQKLDFIKPTFRLKKFIFRFMVVPAKWIRSGRQYVLKLFTGKPYHLLLE